MKEPSCARTLRGFWGPRTNQVITALSLGRVVGMSPLLPLASRAPGWGGPGSKGSKVRDKRVVLRPAESQSEEQEEA